MPSFTLKTSALALVFLQVWGLKSQTPTNCQIPLLVSLDSARKFTLEQEIRNWGGREKFEQVYSKNWQEHNFRTPPPDIPADSFFQIAQKHLLEKLPDSLACAHLRLGMESFFFFKTEVKFTFKFSYQKLDRQQGIGADLIFSFKKDSKTGVWLFEPPQNLPDCKTAPADCFFQNISLGEAVNRVRKTDFADKNTWLEPDFDRARHQIRVTKQVGDGQKQHAFLDLRSGEIQFSDTIQPDPGYARTNTLEFRAKYCPLIFEGEAIGEPIGYQVDSTDFISICTAHLFKIRTVFRGEPRSDTVVLTQAGGTFGGRAVSVSHGTVSMPLKGGRAVFFAMPVNEGEAHRPGSGYSKYPVWYACSEPLHFGYLNFHAPFWAQHLENNLFRPLEKWCGQARKTVPETTPDADEPAISYSLWNLETTDDEAQKMEAKIWISAKEVTSYPVRGAFLLRYNPHCFGRKILKNKHLEWTDYVSTAGIGSSAIRRSVFSSDYKIEARDLDDSTLIFRFYKKNKTAQPVMLPGGTNPRLRTALPFLDLKFEVEDPNEPTGFRLILPKNKKLRHTHFDYESSKTLNYALVELDTAQSLPPVFYLKAVIESFSPDTLTPGSKDVLIIRGRNFRSERTEIGIPVHSEGVYRGNAYPSAEHFLEKNDTVIRLRVPEFLNPPGDEKIFQPCSGERFCVVKNNGRNQTVATADRPLVFKSSGWEKMKPLGCPLGCVEYQESAKIDSFHLVLNIQHSWGAGGERYEIAYFLKKGFFETAQTRYHHTGRDHPPARKGEGKKTLDSLFQHRFEQQKLAQFFHSLVRPAPVWDEKDFGYDRKPFRLDLSRLRRNNISGNGGCADCSDYGLKIEFFSKNKLVQKLETGFDSAFRMPGTGDTAMTQFRVRSMLEWMYLYNFCRMVFPADHFLNRQFFSEKAMDGVAAWAWKAFPELNR